MAPADIVARLNTETVRIIRSEFRKRMEGIGAEPVGDKPAQLAQQIESNTASHAKLMEDARLVVE